MKKLFFLTALLCASLMGWAKQYCEEPLTLSGNAEIKLSCVVVSPGNYQIIIQGTNLDGLGGSFYNPGAVDLRTKITVSAPTVIVCDIEAESAPALYTPLYVMCPLEQNIAWPDDVEWGNCGGGESKTPSELSINATEATLDATVPETFEIETTTAEGYDGTVTYTSDKAGVASVSASGLVTAVGRGTATITVTAPETENYAASSQTLIVTVTGMKKKASGQGYGSMILQDVDLYDWNGEFPGSVQCGNVDLYIVTYGDKIIYKTVVNDGKTFESCTDYFCQIRTWKPDSTNMQEHCALVCSNDLTTRYMTPDQVTRAPGLSSYGNEMLLTSYMVIGGCGARTMDAVPYTRDYIHNYNSADKTAPVLGAATVISGTDDVTISFDAVTSEEVFYMIEDAEHNKKYCSMVPEFVLPKDGSGITYNYSCYAIDFSGNKSAAQPAEVSMVFSVISNQALNRATYSEQNAVNMSSSKAVDGIIHDSRFSSGSVSSPEKAWWAIDLGESYNISSIEMAWEGAYSKDFIIYGADTKPSEWNNIEDYEELYVNTDIVPIIADNSDANTKNNIYAVSGHARYLLFMPSSLANNAWGASFYEFRVFATSVYDPDAGEDTENPVISDASLTSKTHNTAIIAITATDDIGVVKVHAFDASKGYEQDVVPEAGSITLTGLVEKSTYTITLTAYDAMNKVSDPVVLDAFTTDADPTVPQVAAPVPSGTGKEVRPIYSDAFASILAHPFDKDGFAGVVLMMEKDIDGDTCLVYNINGSNEVTWGMYDNGSSAIIAQEAYRGTGMGIDASLMEKLHIDIWSLQAINNAINININDAALTSLRLSHSGEGWQSYDIDLSEFAEGEEGKKIDNVRWMKFNGIGPITGKMALDNVYFWKDNGSGTAISNTEAEVKAVKMIENGQLVIIKNGVKYNVAGQQVK